MPEAPAKRIPGTWSLDLRCRQHRHWGSLPCPWPDCTNGITESRIIQPIPVTGRERVFERAEWPPYRGEIYYSWQDPDEPSYLDANKVAGQEIQRRLNQMSSTPVIYHYTSVAGLMGIAESASLWLTDFAYLNDAREIQHGLRSAEEVLQEIMDSDEYSWANPLIAEWIHKFRNAEPPRICIGCFSLDGDNLSQWRAYGGISVGFSVPLNLGYLPETTVGKVIYDPLEQREVIRIFAHHHCSCLARDKRLFGDKDLSVYNDVDRLYQYLVIFKDQSFVDEREVRLVYVENHELFERMGSPLAPKNFRVSGNLLIPYVSTSDLRSKIGRSASGESRPPQLEIQEVVIGPQHNADVVFAGVKDFLCSKGYANTSVRMSKIPFRTSSRV